MKQIIVTICCFLLVSVTLFGQDARPVTEVFKQSLGDMTSDDANRVTNGQQDWQKFCFQLGTPGQETKKAEAVKIMTETLGNADAVKAHQWLIRQLGRLGDGSCVDAIGKFLDNNDKLIYDQAVWSLANIPNNEAGSYLETRLAKETDAAKKVALTNALKFRTARNEQTLPQLEAIVTTLSNNDSATWDHTLPNLYWLHDVKIAELPNYKERFAKLSPLAQSVLLAALTAQRDRSALPLAIELTKSSDETQKIAGYRALGPLGDAAALTLLVSKINEPGDVGGTIRDSLARLNSEGADAAILAVYEKQTDNGIKRELIEIFRKRQGMVAVPLFEKALASNDLEIRKRAVAALETTGDQTTIAPLIAQYFKEENQEVRNAIERAVVQISSRYSDEDGRGEVLCTEIAKRNETEQIALLPSVGKVGGTAAQKMILTLFTKGRNNIKEAAFKSLCNWPDASVADELYAIAATENDPRAPAAARAYIRVVTLQADRPAKVKLALIEKGMKVTKSVDDKRFLLTRLDPSRSEEVFRFAVQYLNDPELNQAACRAVVDMANDTSFYTRNRVEIDPYLDKVIEISQDKNHVERAKRYKERR